MGYRLCGLVLKHSSQTEGILPLAQRQCDYKHSVTDVEHITCLPVKRETYTRQTLNHTATEVKEIKTEREKQVYETYTKL